MPLLRRCDANSGSNVRPAAGVPDHRAANSEIVWSYYVQMMGYREIIVTKPYLVSKEAQLYSL